MSQNQNVIQIPESHIEQFNEIQKKLQTTQNAYSAASSHYQAKVAELRVMELTLGELAQLPADTPTYQGVGKAFIRHESSALQAELQSRIKTNKETMTQLVSQMETLKKKQAEFDASFRDFVESLKK